MQSAVAMPKSFIKDAPSLTVSDVLLQFPSNDTVTVLIKLDRLLTNQLLSNHFINVLPYLGLDLSNTFKIKCVAKA
jgi:hypothetical protein